MTKSFLLATALFFTSAAGLSYAQPGGTTTTTTVAPAQPATPMPAPVAEPAAVPAPAAPAPAAPQAPGTTVTTTTTTTVPEAVTGACNTRKTVGDPCSCLKAPTTMGVSTASSTGGRNMCVIP